MCSDILDKIRRWLFPGVEIPTNEPPGISFMHIVESTDDAIVAHSNSGEITLWNRGAERLYGYFASEIIGKNWSILVPRDHARQDADIIERIHRGERVPHVRTAHRRKDGSLVAVSATISPIVDSAMKIAGISRIVRDITQQMQIENAIYELAFHDVLTELPNRRLFMDRLGHALNACHRNRQFVALFFLDLDRFKLVNDTYGHDKGDLLLKQVGQRLLGSVREADTVARFGGDEFVVLMENLGLEEAPARRAAEIVGGKILTNLGQVYALGDLLHRTTPSIGVAMTNGDGMSVNELIKQADVAMYAAKTAGRNTIHFARTGFIYSGEKISPRVA